MFDFENKKFLNRGKEYKIVYLEDINFNNMKLIINKLYNKKDLKLLNKNRIIYKENNIYYKIWDKDYIHNPTFTYVMNNDIYDNEIINTLYGLIFDKEKYCRGYITYEGELSEKYDIHELKDLYELYKKNIERTKFILTDPGAGNWRPGIKCNIVKFKNKYSFIDLECIYPLTHVVKGLVRARDHPDYICMKICHGFKLNITPQPYNDYIKENYKEYFEKAYEFDFEKKKFENRGKEYKIVFLEDINFNGMEIIKNREHREDDVVNLHRIIYKDSTNNLFYKIWEKEYLYNDFFIKAIKNNVYDNRLILPFYGLIFDKEKICRGYITYGGTPSDKELCDLPKLYDILKKNTFETKFVFLDPDIINIIKYKNKYSFIDYEEIIQFKFIKKTNILSKKHKRKLGQKVIGIINNKNSIINLKIKPKYYNEYIMNTYF